MLIGKNRFYRFFLPFRKMYAEMSTIVSAGLEADPHGNGR